MVIPSGPLRAIAELTGEGELLGTVKFYPVPCAVLVVAEVNGLPETQSRFYALHIHEGESCGGTDFSETGGHYDPEGKPHPFHAGDLPPILASDGRGLLAVETDRFHIEDVIGRTVVIHEGMDDFSTQPAGNAGRKIACGIIYAV